MRWLVALAAVCAAFTQDDKTRQEYEEKLVQCKTAEDYYKLGQWCEKKGLKEEAMKAHTRAIELDPEHARARAALGYKKVLGKWVREVDYNDPSWWAHPKVNQKQVDEAIVKGCEWLLKQKLPDPAHPFAGKMRTDELVFYTLVSAGWDRKDPRFQALLAKVLSNPLDRTYHVALRAMALSELDPRKYQQELARCAQFLVDNQCKNGQWSYGEKVPLAGTYPTSKNGPIPDIETGVQGGDPKKKDTFGQIEIRRNPAVKPKDSGDNSNSQYAMLGIRACLKGLVVVPRQTLLDAEKWWEKDQKQDGGWGYSAGEAPMGAAETSYGSMTAGAVGSLVIIKYYLKRVYGEDRDWKNAASISKGLGWLSANWKVDLNPGGQISAWHRYYLYAVERAGRLLETEQIGSHEWYVEGAEFLLKDQNADGSWKEEKWSAPGAMGGQLDVNKKALLPGAITETCFAILFLRRATPKISETLIESGDSKKK